MSEYYDVYMRREMVESEMQDLEDQIESLQGQLANLQELYDLLTDDLRELANEGDEDW